MLFRLLLLLLALALTGCMTRSPAPVVDRTPVPVRPQQPVYTPPPVVNPVAVLPELHTVGNNDSMASIAVQYNIDYNRLLALNAQIQNPNQLAPGQLIRLQATAPFVPLIPVSKPTEPVRPTVVTPPPVAVPQDGLKREPKAQKIPYSDSAYNQMSGKPAPNVVGQAGVITPQITPAPVAAPAVVVTQPTPVKPAEEGDITAWDWPTQGRITKAFSETALMKGIDISGRVNQSVFATAAGKVIFAGPFRGYGNMVIIKHNNTYNSVYAHNAKIVVQDGQTVARGTKIAEMGQTESDAVKLHFEIRKAGKPVDPAKLLPAN
jgi:lipoprotein NlpD